MKTLSGIREDDLPLERRTEVTTDGKDVARKVRSTEAGLFGGRMKSEIFSYNCTISLSCEQQK